MKINLKTFDLLSPTAPFQNPVYGPMFIAVVGSLQLPGFVEIQNGG